MKSKDRAKGKSQFVLRIIWRFSFHFLTRTEDNESEINWLRFDSSMNGFIEQFFFLLSNNAKNEEKKLSQTRSGFSNYIADFGNVCAIDVHVRCYRRRDVHRCVTLAVATINRFVIDSSATLNSFPIDCSAGR